MRILESISSGPACNYGDAHIFYVLHILDQSRSMSRSNLARYLEIGEGSVRRIVQLLKEWGLISVRQTGITLTDYGREFLRNIPLRLVPVPHSDYVLGAFQQGVVVYGASKKISNGMYQRDRAIIAGANGASVFVMEGNTLIMPKSWNMDVRDPDFAKAVRNMTRLCNGDVLAVSGASDANVAAISAIAIGLDLV